MNYFDSSGAASGAWECSEFSVMMYDQIMAAALSANYYDDALSNPLMLGGEWKLPREVMRLSDGVALEIAYLVGLMPEEKAEAYRERYGVPYRLYGVFSSNDGWNVSHVSSFVDHVHYLAGGGLGSIPVWVTQEFLNRTRLGYGENGEYANEFDEWGLRRLESLEEDWLSSMRNLSGVRLWL